MAQNEISLGDFEVGPHEYDKAFALLDDPEIGIALIADPQGAIDIQTQLALLESSVIQDDPRIGTATVSGFGGDLHLFLTSNWPAVCDGYSSQLPNRGELDPMLKLRILSALQRSIEIRREIAIRFNEVPGFSTTSALEQFLHPGNTPGIVGEGVMAPPSRIDCHTSKTMPRGFNTGPHGDSTLFTEHGGQTQQGLRILGPRERKLLPCEVPAGYRLLTRGREWQLARTVDHIATPHDVMLLDTSTARTRWVALWRVPSIRSRVEYRTPHYLEVAKEREQQLYDDLLI